MGPQGRFCKIGAFIGCHDTSCQMGGGETACQSADAAGCTAEAAACAKEPGCVAFSVMVKPPRVHVFELAHNNPSVLRGFPDTDWSYYVDTKPWPVDPKAD